MTCYLCHQPGHIKWDYRQRQGSQCFGTTQYQSSVGQAWTQFIPSHLSAAQRNQTSPRVLHERLPLPRQAKGARVWAEVEDMAHRLGHQGPRGVSNPSYHRPRLQISQLYRVWFCYLAYEQAYHLILVHRIHSSLHHL